MTQNIKNFIEEGEKEFEEKFRPIYLQNEIEKFLEFSATLSGKVNLQQQYQKLTLDREKQFLNALAWHSSRQISLIKMIMEMAKEMRLKNENAIDKLEEVDERARITNLLNENLQIGYQLALQDISLKLKELIKE